jgi:hypothetical protein
MREKPGAHFAGVASATNEILREMPAPFCTDEMGAGDATATGVDGVAPRKVKARGLATTDKGHHFSENRSRDEQFFMVNPGSPWAL